MYAAALEDPMTDAPNPNVVWPVRHPAGHVVHARTAEEAFALQRGQLVNWPPPVGTSPTRAGESE